MLEALLGSSIKEKILIFLVSRESGYARQIAEFYEVSVTSVVKQLHNLEQGNVLYTQVQGRTKVYKFNPRYSFLKELEQLLLKTLDFYPKDLKNELIYHRRRPRRSNKVL